VIAFLPQNLFGMILNKNTCQKGNCFIFFRWITSSVKNS